MEDNKIIFKSSNRRYFRMTVVGIFAVLSFYYGVSDDNSILIVLGIILTIGVLIQYFGHVQTVIEISNKTLKATRNVSGLMLSKDEIALSEIQTSHFEQKSYDSIRLFSNFIGELIFPTNSSSLTIHTVNGKKTVLHINTSEKEIEHILKRLPERIPN